MPHFFNDAYIRNWLGYGSYVDEQRRILYVETPKAACSSIKHLLRTLVTKEDIIADRMHTDISLILRINDRSQIPLPPLTAFSGDRFREIMTGPNWFRFCVIRHPYDRFFSAWRDKIFLCEPSYEAYASADNERFVRFSHFAGKVVAEEDPFTCDPHWRCQTALLLPDDISYNRIYNVDGLSLNHLAADLQQHLKTVGISDRVTPLRRINQGWSLSGEGFLTTEVLASLRRFYRSDFERFGFAEREAVVADGQSEAAIVTEFSDGVFSRNRLIAERNSQIQALATEIEHLRATGLEKTNRSEVLRTSLERICARVRGPFRQVAGWLWR